MRENNRVPWGKIDALREQYRQAARDRLAGILRKINNFLTRKRRIALDLLLAAAVLGVTWYASNYPLWGEAAFRRLEKQNLLAPGEIVFHQGRTLGTSGTARLTKEVFISLGADWAAVGYLDNGGDYAYWKEVGPNAFTMVPVYGSWLEAWALEPGPAVIPLLFPVHSPERGKEEILGWGAAAVRLPPEAAGGRLLLTDRDGLEHTVTGTLQGEGVLWFWEIDKKFQIEGYYHTDNRYVLGEPWMPGLDYVLELYDPDGGILDTLAGRILG